MNAWLTGRLLTQASTVVSHGRPDKTAWRASPVKLANSTARCGVDNADEEEKIGAPVEKMHRLGGRGAMRKRKRSGCPRVAKRIEAARFADDHDLSL